MLRALPFLVAGLAASAALASPAPVLAAELVDLAVVDRESGQWMSPVRHRGQDWIVGTPGHRYSVRLTNTTGQRVLVVLSVDGVNAISGQTANPSQTGYVLEPWQSTQVNGWRKSLDHVAQFVFTDLGDSYAARTGRPDNVGVIGVAVFEQAQPWRERQEVSVANEERYRGEQKTTAPAAQSRSADMAAQPAPQSIGTGHGDRERSRARQTDFVRASRSPAQISELRYDDRPSLVARGVLRTYPPYYRHDRPSAFPQAFVADPPDDR